MQQWVVLKNNIKIYIKIYIKFTSKFNVNFNVNYQSFIYSPTDVPVSCLKKQY